MVFDNADNLASDELEQYFPSGLGGNILITSRNSGLKHLTSHENSLEVKEMEENDAISLLLKAACLDESQEALQVEASKIVNELFCIPLAIDQAGAFIAFEDIDIRDYLKEYSQYRARLLSYPAFKGASSYNRTLYQTWDLSYKKIQQRAESDDPHRANPANSAMFLFAMFSFFHFDEISEEIFAYAAAQGLEKISDNEQISVLPLASYIIDRRLLPLDKTGKWDNFIFREGIQILSSFSLIKVGSQSGMFAVHPLIHAWGRDRMSSEDKQKYSLMAYIMLAGCLQEDFDEQPCQFRRTLVTHLRANIQHSVMADKKMIERYFDDAHEKFGRLLSEQGYYSEALKFQVEVLDARRRALGEEHLGTISAISDIAGTYHSLGKHADAEKLQIKVVDIRNRLLGQEHPNTISAMGRLAHTYHSVGKYADSEQLQIKVIYLRNTLLGEEHPQTIDALSNLAITYKSLGKYADAVKLQVQVLDLRNRIFGGEHSDTILAMGNLAITYKSLGKYADARKLQIKALEIRHRLLEGKHPDIITAMSNLAAINGNLGKYADAEKLQIQGLDLRNKLLGKEHLYTILAMSDLANTYHSLEKYTGAEKLKRKVLDLRNRLLGEEHPDTILAMGNLANTYYSLGKYGDAEKLQFKVLNLRTTLHGEEHPDTISAMGDLAHTSQSLGEYANEEKLKINILDLKSRLLGEEHPDTINAMENLAITLYYLQKYPDAARLEVQVVDVRKKIFGEQHSKTVNAIAILAEIKSQANTNTSGTESKKKSELYLWSFVMVPLLYALYHLLQLLSHSTYYILRLIYHLFSFVY